MLRAITLIFAIFVYLVPFLVGCSKETSEKVVTGQDVKVVQAAGKAGVVQSGEELFKQYCFSCHPNGGNVSDPRLSLRGSALKSHHIAKPEDIVRIMRNPASRMIRFDESTLSDKDARAIAEYILSTFK